MKCFVLRPSRKSPDAAERACHSLGHSLIRLCGKGSFGTVDFDSFKASRVGRFKAALKNERDRALFVAYSHGNADALVVGRSWVVKKRDAPAFQGKMCAMIACCALDGLGRAMVGAGAIGAVGFRKDVPVWTMQDNRLAILGGAFASAFVAWMTHPVRAPLLAGSIRGFLQAAIDTTSKSVATSPGASSKIGRVLDLQFIGMLREVKESVDSV